MKYFEATFTKSDEVIHTEYVVVESRRHAFHEAIEAAYEKSKTLVINARLKVTQLSEPEFIDRLSSTII